MNSKNFYLKMKTGKVTLIGSADVGKTCLIRKFLGWKLDLEGSATIWPSVFRCRFSTENGTISLEIWDTSGQERFRSVVNFYLKDVDAAVIVFDLTRSITFTEAKTWANVTFYESTKSPCLVLVGNKKDLWRKRAVSREDAESYARKIGAIYLECSAKDHQDVCKVFAEAANEIFKCRSKAIKTTEIIKNTCSDVYFQKNIS